MCWITYCKKPEHIIATKDIPIYKIMHFKRDIFFKKKFISAFKEFQYKLGKIYTEKMDIPITNIAGKYYINRGFHSYNPLVTYITEGPTISASIFIRCGSEDLGGYSLNNNLVIVYGYIPKGACYYENEFGECVSNAIKLTHYKKITERNLYKLI